MSNPVSARTLRTQLSLNNLITIVLALTILVLANYLSFRHHQRVDLSRNKYYQLSEKTIKIIKNLPEPIHITTYLISSPIKGEIDNLLKEYQFQGGKNIEVDRVDPALDLDKAEKLAQKFKFGSQENLVIFEYKDQQKFVDESQLADYDESNAMTGQAPRLKAFKGEQQFTAAIQSLVEGKAAKVYFLTGHGEREIGNVSAPAAIGALETRIKRDNNLTESLNLASVTNVPDDCDLLIVAGPKTPLAPAEVDAISDYLDKHGKVVILQDPEAVSGLETVMQKYGMELQPDLIMARGKVEGMGDMLFATALGTTYAEHPAVNPMRNLNLQMPNCRSVAIVKDAANPNAAKVTLLVKTPAGFWGETNFKDKKPTFDPNTDIAGPLTLAAVYDGGEIPGEGVKVTGARLVVMGSSTFIANQDLDGVGLDFFLNITNWMMKKETAIGISPKLAQEFGLDVSPLQLTTIAILALTFIPLLALGSGLIVWISRRK